MFCQGLLPSPRPVPSALAPHARRRLTRRQSSKQQNAKKKLEKHAIALLDAVVKDAGR